MPLMLLQIMEKDIMVIRWWSRMNITDMSIEEVAELINTALQENKGVSVNKICDTLRIKRSTLKSRLTRGGYSFNANHNRYEVGTTEENTNITTGNITNKDIEHTTESKKCVTGVAKGSSTKNATRHTTVNTIQRITEHTTKNKLTIEERILALERAVEMLKGKSQKVKGITITNTKDTTVKSIRLYAEVKEELDKYIAEHKEIKVIDIISNAILEYIKRH